MSSVSFGLIWLWASFIWLFWLMKFTGSFGQCGLCLTFTEKVSILPAVLADFDIEDKFYSVPWNGPIDFFEMRRPVWASISYIVSRETAQLFLLSYMVSRERARLFILWDAEASLSQHKLYSVPWARQLFLLSFMVSHERARLFFLRCGGQFEPT